MNIKPKIFIKSASYEVENTIDIKISDVNFKTTSSYAILIKKRENLKYDFLLNRGNISINGTSIDTKFLNISDQYFSCLFPINFLIENGKLHVANFSEITNRISQKDKELKSNFSGDGIDYISSEFLAKTNSEEKMRNFISSLNLINALQLSLQKFENIKDFNWQILPISDTSWKGYSTFDVENNLLEYNAKMQINTEFTEKLRHFASDNNYEYNLTTFDEFSSEFHHETEYINEGLKFIVAKTNINIKLPDFEYNEAFIIKSKTAN